MHVTACPSIRCPKLYGFVQVIIGVSTKYVHLFSQLLQLKVLFVTFVLSMNFRRNSFYCKIKVSIVNKSSHFVHCDNKLI